MSNGRPSWRDDRRKTAERGYGGAWQRARDGYLRLHPLCVMCKEQGILTAATVVDHKVPHEGDQALFWDQDNWQSLCKLHHDSTKQKQEQRRQVIGCSADGLPRDADHHWNAGGGGS